MLKSTSPAEIAQARAITQASPPPATEPPATEMATLTFQDLRAHSEAHLHTWAPEPIARTLGEWAQPPARFEDAVQAPLPPQLLRLLAILPARKLAPVLAEIVMQLDRFAATKKIDLGDAIATRFGQVRAGKSPDLPTELRQGPLEEMKDQLDAGMADAGVPDSVRVRIGNAIKGPP